METSQHFTLYYKKRSTDHQVQVADDHRYERWEKKFQWKKKKKERRETNNSLKSIQLDKH